MKATLDIPDDLYRQVKTKTALQGRRIRDVTIELYEGWLREAREGETPMAITREQWLEEWRHMGDEACRRAPVGRPTATEVLAEDRKRLERR